MLASAVLTTNLPRRANLGCGNDYRDGWLNVDNADWHKCDFSGDIRRLDGLPAGHFDEIVCKDVLEHIGRTEQVATLTGWARLLARGGKLFISVPSFFDLAHAARYDPAYRSVEMQHTAIQCGWGTQAYPGDYHHCSYTPLTLLDLAAQAGLQITKVWLVDGWLYYVELTQADVKVSDEQWLHQAYFRHLWRPADAPGLQHYLVRLRAGVPRESVAQDLARAFDQTPPAIV